MTTKILIVNMGPESVDILFSDRLSRSKRVLPNNYTEEYVYDVQNLRIREVKDNDPQKP
jgi:hypothetical protein